jgi:hypothetical protein
MSTGGGGATNYELAYRLACSQLAGRDPLAVAGLAGVPYDAAGQRWTVRYLGLDYEVAYPSGKVSTVGEGGAGGGDVAPPSVIARIIILHYLLNASGTAPAGQFRAFREMPGGDIYVLPFTNRTIKPLAGIFGRNPRGLVEAGLLLGGTPAGVGHGGVTIPALPRVPVTLGVWEGDDEFPASANIVFDQTASDYLPTEDLVALAGETVRACARRHSEPQRPSEPRREGRLPDGVVEEGSP